MNEDGDADAECDEYVDDSGGDDGDDDDGDDDGGDNDDSGQPFFAENPSQALAGETTFSKLAQL